MEVGEDHAKSSWPLWTGLHMCYKSLDNKKQWKFGANYKIDWSTDYFLELGSMKE